MTSSLAACHWVLLLFLLLFQVFSLWLCAIIVWPRILEYSACFFIFFLLFAVLEGFVETVSSSKILPTAAHSHLRVHPRNSWFLVAFLPSRMSLLPSLPNLLLIVVISFICSSFHSELCQILVWRQYFAMSESSSDVYSDCSNCSSEKENVLTVLGINTRCSNMQTSIISLNHTSGPRSV